jgi:hypothetical protein
MIKYPLLTSYYDFSRGRCSLIAAQARQTTTLNIVGYDINYYKLFLNCTFYLLSVRVRCYTFVHSAYYYNTYYQFVILSQRFVTSYICTT